MIMRVSTLLLLLCVIVAVSAGKKDGKEKRKPVLYFLTFYFRQFTMCRYMHTALTSSVIP